MTRRSYVQVDGVLYEKGTEPVSEMHYVHAEFTPYKSMVDGTMIESRTQHREHLRRHGCVEVGNEVKAQFSYYDRAAKDVERRQRESRVGLLRAQFDGLSSKQLKAAIKKDADFVKWNSREG